MPPLEKLLQIRILFLHSHIANNIYKFAKASLYIPMSIIWKFSVSVTLLDWRNNIKPVFWCKLNIVFVQDQEVNGSIARKPRFQNNPLEVSLPRDTLLLLEYSPHYMSVLQLVKYGLKPLSSVHNVFSVAIASYRSYS